MKKLLYIFTLSIFLFTFLQVSEAHAAEDKTAPVIEEIKILTPVVAPGGKVKIQIMVSDDVSGVERISVNFTSPSKVTGVIAFLKIDHYQPLSNSYVLESEPLTVYAELGEWDISQIRVSDFAGNSIYQDYIMPEMHWFNDISFTVNPNAPTEETPGTDDGFVAIDPKKGVPLNKEFTITFNMNIDISTILQNNIYIKDSNGNNVPLMFIIDRGADLQTSQVIVAPVGSYRVGSAYTLYIKDIVSTSGSKMAYGTKMKFTTK